MSRRGAVGAIETDGNGGGRSKVAEVKMAVAKEAIGGGGATNLPFGFLCIRGLLSRAAKFRGSAFYCFISQCPTFIPKPPLLVLHPVLFSHPLPAISDQ